VLLAKYAPDLDPMEQVLAKFKTRRRKAGARTCHAVSDACAQLLNTCPPAKCAASIRNAAYAQIQMLNV